MTTQAILTRHDIKHYTNNNGTFEIVENAIPLLVDTHPTRYFFISLHYGKWGVSEATTGTLITGGHDTIDGAIIRAKRLLDRYAPAQLTSSIDGHAISPFVPYDKSAYLPPPYGVCNVCGEDIPEDDENAHGTICTECMENGCMCSRCNTYVSIDDARSGDNGDPYCDECWNSLFVRCGACDEVVSTDDARDIEGDPYCRDCYREYSVACDICHSVFHTDSDRLHWEEETDRQLCDSCYETRSQVIRGYHSGYSIYYHRLDGIAACEASTLYLGVELETDGYSDGVDECAGELYGMSDNGGLFVMETDGSLRNGFEIISQPCTLDYHIEKFPWEEITSTIRNNGGKSNDTDTCGLHIHFSRAFWGDKYDANALRLLYLFERFWETLVRISRRHGDRWKQYAQRYNDDFANCTDISYKVRETREKGRYYAVNLNHRNTVEIRLFKGTLKVSTIYACLELVDFLARYVTTVTTKDLQDTTWEKTVEKIDRDKYPHLMQYLIDRNLAKAVN